MNENEQLKRLDLMLIHIKDKDYEECERIIRANIRDIEREIEDRCENAMELAMNCGYKYGEKVQNEEI